MEDPKGAAKVRLRTARKKLHDACRRIKGWIKENRHLKGANFIRALNRRLQGHYNYFNVPGNLNYFQSQITQIAPENSVKFVGNSTSGDGSPDSPYQNIETALVSAPDNATLVFKAGSDNTFSTNTLTINRPLTLKGCDVTRFYCGT